MEDTKKQLKAMKKQLYYRINILRIQILKKKLKFLKYKKLICKSSIFT